MPRRPAVTLPGSPLEVSIGDPPLVRFGSLQRLPAALCCSGMPAPNHPASTFGVASQPTFAVLAALVLAVFSASRRCGSLRASIAPRPAGHSPEDYVVPASQACRGLIAA
jgi:hypothetical protein